MNEIRNDYRQFPEADPRHHTLKIRSQFDDLINQLRQEVHQIQDPQARALFETSAEVLGGLTRAFEHYENQAEPAWEKNPPSVSRQ